MTEIVITDEMLNCLRDKVKRYMDGKRYVHTLGVEKSCADLGTLLLPDKVSKLRAAALLHDITKSACFEEQLKLCSQFGIIYGSDGASSPKLLHAATGSELIKRDFPEYADDEIVSAVRWHTTGRYGMSLFEGIVFLADYIEDNRTYDDCVEVRRFFYDSLKKGEDTVFNVYVKTMIKSLDLSVQGLIDSHESIDINTVEAKNYFVKLLQGEI